MKLQFLAWLAISFSLSYRNTTRFLNEVRAFWTLRVYNDGPQNRTVQLIKSLETLVKLLFLIKSELRIIPTTAFYTNKTQFKLHRCFDSVAKEYRNPYRYSYRLFGTPADLYRVKTSSPAQHRRRLLVKTKSIIEESQSTRCEVELDPHVGQDCI